MKLLRVVCLAALQLIGVLLAASALSGTETYTYDELGRLVTVDYSTGKTESYALDAAGNRKQTQASDGTQPSTPTNLTPTATSPTQVSLTWTASTDNVGVTGYWLERCTLASCVTFLHMATPTSASFGDSGLTSYTAYRYRVRAMDANGNFSAFSTIASVTTLDGTPPSSPTNLAATVISATRVDLTWTASTDNVGVTGYLVERCSGSGCSNFSQIGTPAGNSYSDTTAVQLTNYTYRVRAKDAANNLSGYSGSTSASTPDGTPPSTPTGLSATAISATQVNLSWTASTDNVAVTGYQVDRCTGVSCSSFSQIGTSATNSYSDTTVGPATTYGYRVRAYDAATNVSGNSTTSYATTPGGVPSPPTLSSNKTMATEPASYTLSWTSVSGATSYKLFESGSQVYSGTLLSKAFSGMVAGTYQYVAQACNASGCSANSNQKTVIVCAPGGCQ